MKQYNTLSGLPEDLVAMINDSQHWTRTEERNTCKCGVRCSAAGDEMCLRCYAKAVRRGPKGTFRKRSFLRGIPE